MSYETQVA